MSDTRNKLGERIKNIRAEDTRYHNTFEPDNCNCIFCEMLAALAALPATPTPPQFEPLLTDLTHTRSCPALTLGHDEECTCGLIWRIRLRTEMEMHNAWRKRAEEAEAATPAPSEDAIELEQTLDLIHDADMRAIKMWQKAHPGNDLVWPDRAKMIFWLLEQLQWGKP